MGFIDEFVGQYERQFDYWDALAHTTQGLLEAELSSSGVRAIVTSRAKSVDRLAEKLARRDRMQPYQSVAEIGEDIADLAGVRVALYFPGQMGEVERIIRNTLDVRKVKLFPADGTNTPRASGGESHPETDAAAPAPAPDAHRQRFPGYGARHFRIFIPATHLIVGQERFASALVEVQAASVLMHAWSEVEHDLVYKPLEGALSPSEHALLDQLNGLVVAGEIALEQLQKAGDARVAAAATPFRDHYELAEFLRTRLSPLGAELTDATLGRVDVLFDFVVEQEAATAASVGPYLDLLERDFERRPVADQLADLMLSGDESRYKAYLRAMTARQTSRRPHTTFEDLMAKSPGTLALGEFIAEWVLFESVLNDLTGADGERRRSLLALSQLLVKQQLISTEQLTELDMMRQLRNQVLHGRSQDIPPEQLRDAAAWLRALTAEIEHKT